MTDRVLAGQRAVVTGGAAGIGRASALALARAGADVVVLDLSPADETLSALAAFDVEARALEVDVRDRQAVHTVMADAAGPDGRVDVLVTSAGIYSRAQRLDDLTEDDLDAVLGVNVGGVVWSVQAALPYLRDTGAGRIILLGSGSGKSGGLLVGADYTMSKGAVHVFAKALARQEAANGIRANAIAAGAVRTDMIAGQDYPPSYCPLNRIAEPEEIAEAVLFLASPASSYVTGSVMDVSGGYVMG